MPGDTPGTEHETDFVLLADIFTTGYHGCELAEVSPGESVAVYGAGPAGLMRMGAGQCNVKRYNRQLRDLIIAGRTRPGFVVSHHLPLEQAPAAYEKFDKRVAGYPKVILHP